MKTVLGVNKWNIKEISFVSAFVISLALSMLFMVVYKSELLLQSDILSEGSLSLVKLYDDSNSSLFLSILKERIWIIPLLFLSSTTYLAMPAVYFTIVWYGVTFGTIVATLMLRYGIAGVVLITLCSLPQYLFYIPALIIALRLSAVTRTPDRRFWAQLFVLEAVVFMGCLAESYINTLFVAKIIKIFIGV